MFGYDTTPNFVAGVAVAQVVNFAICARFVKIDNTNNNSSDSVILKKNNLSKSYETRFMFKSVSKQNVLVVKSIIIVGHLRNDKNDRFLTFSNLSTFFQFYFGGFLLLPRIDGKNDQRNFLWATWRRIHQQRRNGLVYPKLNRITSSLTISKMFSIASVF